jgi:hypothetical protein
VRVYALARPPMRVVDKQWACVWLNLRQTENSRVEFGAKLVARLMLNLRITLLSMAYSINGHANLLTKHNMCACGQTPNVSQRARLV